MTSRSICNLMSVSFRSLAHIYTRTHIHSHTSLRCSMAAFRPPFHMSKRAFASLSPHSPAKRARTASFVEPPDSMAGDVKFNGRDWPASHDALRAARAYLLDVVAKGYQVMIAPDKDADGLTAGTILYHTLIRLGHPPDKIMVHLLQKGTNIHSDTERERLIGAHPQRLIVLDQGSRPGRAIIPPSPGISGKTTLIIDHHMSEKWPDDSLVLTACNSSPIATTSLLVYMLLKDLHPDVYSQHGWRAVVGVYGDLGTATAKWGVAPWPTELGLTVKNYGGKVLSDAVSAVNAPRRTADYNVTKAWEILLNATHPREVAHNAFLKLCRLDVNAETERWARTPPKFSIDGRVALISVASGFQVHPVIATRWAGTLGRKSTKLVMIMCANTDFNPDSSLVSFSCRLSSPLRKLPDDDRPNLIALLREYGASIPGFMDRVGDDFARGHKEATGGIIPKDEFGLLIEAMGIAADGRGKITSPTKPKAKAGTRDIKEFFKVQSK